MINKNLISAIKKYGLEKDVEKGNFGLEKENLRVDKDGKLALTPHPKVFGDKSKNPYITIDFSESQVEMITPAFKNVEDTYYFLENLHDIVTENLEGEYLWTQSNPPIAPKESEIPTGQFPSKIEKQKYRESLAERYGSYVQLISGIHYNFSFENEFLVEFYENYKESKEYQGESYKEFKNNIYMKVARNYIKYSWLLIYVLGASGPVHKSYDPKVLQHLDKFSDDLYYFKDGISFRSGIYGYRNTEELAISHNSLEEYIRDIKKYIDKKTIQGANEYYSTLRLKGKNPDDIFKSLVEDGIEYLEVRCVDLNPFTKIGIDIRDMRFIHYFLMYMLIEGEENFNLLIGKDNEKYLATYGQSKDFRLKDTKGLGYEVRPTACKVMNKMKETFKELGLFDSKMEETFKFELSKVDNPENMYVNRVIKNVREEGYTKFHMDLAKKYLEETKRNSFSLKNYEDMELSTQILIKDAIKRGIKFEIIDRGENFITLEKDGKKEYVKQATKTSRDSYVTMLIMENKIVSKKVLEENGIKVPAGRNYDDIELAKRDFRKVEGKKIVVKPKSTNFGLGISIFQNAFTKEEYIKALEIAFSEDKSVLVEEFISGREFRFLVMGDEVVGILHRVPANVCGDGEKTIRELVEIKNKNHLRGTHYERPLQRIKLGDIEELLLKNQGKDFDYIPKKDEIVYLRENSNISTGGDSIDFTDDIPDVYKEIAVRAAKSAKATFCGVDIMIDDITKTNPEGNYAVIEINFNPAIHIHCYPAEGINRGAGERILDILF